MNFLGLLLLLYAVAGQETIRKIVFPQDADGWTTVGCTECSEMEKGFDGEDFPWSVT